VLQFWPVGQQPFLPLIGAQTYPGWQHAIQGQQGPPELQQPPKQGELQAWRINLHLSTGVKPREIGVEGTPTPGSNTPGATMKDAPIAASESNTMKIMMMLMEPAGCDYSLRSSIKGGLS